MADRVTRDAARLKSECELTGIHEVASAAPAALVNVPGTHCIGCESEMRESKRGEG